MGRRRDRGPKGLLLLLAALVVAGVGAALWMALGVDFATEDGTNGAAANGAGGTTTAADASKGGAAAGHRPAKPGQASLIAGFGAVRGVVRLFKTREPVANVPLTLRRVAVAEGGTGNGVAPVVSATFSAATDATGAFSFAHVAAGPGWEISGGQTGYAPLEVTGLDVTPDQTLDLGVLWLAVPVDLPALVVDTTGTPIEGAEVAAFALGRTLPEETSEWSNEAREQRTLSVLATPRPVRTAKTDAQGRAVVKGLMPGAYRAVASAAGKAPSSRMNLVLVPDAKTETVRFVLGPAHALEGRVFDEKGAPVAGARVIAVMRQGWLPSLDKAAGDTGADGSYAIDGLASGAYLVYVARSGRPLIQAGGIGIPDVPRFDVHLRPGGTLRGTVTGEDGRPVPGAEVWATMQNMWSPMVAASGADGVFELKDVPAGPLGTFRVTAEGFVPFPEPSAQQQGEGDSLREGQVMTRDVVLRRGSEAVLTVIGEGAPGSALPIEGAEVRLHLATMWGDESPPRTATTDATGHARVTGLLAGEYLAVVVAEGWIQPDLPSEWRNLLQAPAAIPAGCRVSAVPGPPLQREFRLTRGLSVSGRVFAPSGSPAAAGAVVTIDPLRADFPTFTDDEGRFRVATVPTMRRAVARAQAADGAAGASEPFAVTASGGGAADAVEIRMKEPGRVTGTVRTRDGRVPVGAFVRWAPGRLQGDWWGWRAIETAERFPVSANGAFEIPGVAAGEVTIRADAEDLLPASKFVTVAPGNEAGGVVLLLGAPREIRGRVQSKQGQPVEGAFVSAWQESRRGRQDEPATPGIGGQPTAQSDAAGRFVLRNVDDGRWSLWATAPGYAGAATVSTTPDAAEVLLVLAQGRSITGSVKDPSGKPFPGVPIGIEATDRDAGRRNWWGQSVYSAPDGGFEFQDVPEGAYRLRVSANDNWGRDANVEDTVKDGVSAGDRDVEIVVRTGLLIEGRVVDHEKKPVRSAWIYASARGAGDEEGRGGGDTERWVQARPDGTFRVAGLRAGGYDIGAYGAFRTKTAEGVAAGTTGLEIQVEPASSIAGVVYDEKGLSQPSFDLRVRAAGETEWAWRDVATPGDGAFVVTGLEEGAWDLQFTAQGWAPTVLLGVPAGRSDVEVRLGRGLEIAGVVVDGAGRPLARAWVEVAPTRTGADAQAQEPVQVRVGTDGRFRAPGLLGGTYRLVCRANNFAPLIARDVRAGTDDLKIVMLPGTTVTGRVVDADGAGVPGVHLLLRTDDDLDVAQTQSGADGAFEIRQVPDSGTWRILARWERAGEWVDQRVDSPVESGAKDVKVVVKP